MAAEKTIENTLKENLSGNLLTNALDLVDYLKQLGMTNGIEPSDTRFYYKDELMCIFITFKDENHPSGRFFICDCPLSDHDDFPISEDVKEFVHASVNKCGSCDGDCGHEQRGATKVIFGKEYDNLCSSEVIFFDPDAKAIEKIKKLMDLWKFKVDNIDGYSSQDR